MAKYETTLTANFDRYLAYLDGHILGDSVSASYEDGSDITCGNVRCAVRVYERYSAFGQNRVSMTLTLVGAGDQLSLSVITSGGSQAMFFKINTVGEETFLDKLVRAIEAYQGQ